MLNLANDIAKINMQLFSIADDEDVDAQTLRRTLDR